ncbi:MAG: FecR domain-containing protein [Bacteroidia bacterium]|nr:FecR domain-containing protein [Bacteroidia bacterium]
MNEQDYSLESLIASESFKAYCLKTSDKEVQKWTTWLKDHPEKEADVAEAHKWVLAMSSVAEPNEAIEEWSKLSAKLPSQKTVRRLIPKWAPIAIAASIALLIGIFVWQFPQEQSYKEISTAYGEIMLLDLPDGSQLTLNGHSRVKYNESWDTEATREIWLEGEGYFDVRHIPQKPLVVHMKYGDIKVMGTKFNALHREDVQRVTLIEGFLEIKGPNQEEIELEPGDQMVFADQKWKSNKIDPEPVTAWKDNMMIYRDATIESIINKLKWDFNWDIQVMEDSIMDRRVNAFIRENNPELLLQALAEIYDMEFEKLDEGKYLIK